MDKETYQILVRDIEKYPDKYKLKEGKLIKIKSDKELKVLRRNEIEPILSIVHEHLLSGHFGLEATLTRVLISFGKYRTEPTVISVRSVNFIKIYRTE